MSFIYTTLFTDKGQSYTCSRILIFKPRVHTLFIQPTKGKKLKQTINKKETIEQ